MNPDVYARNRAVLDQVYPHIAHRLDAIPSERQYPIHQTKNKQYTILVDGDGGKQVFLHSRYAPDKEAQKLTQISEDRKYKNIFCFGMGLAYHILELYDAHPSHHILCVVEQDLLVLKSCMHCVDMSRLIADTERVYLFVGQAPIEIFNDLRYIAVSMIVNGFFILEHPPSVCRQKSIQSYYRAVQDMLKEYVSWARANVGTSIHESKKFTRNVVQNLHDYISLPSIRRFHNRYASKPAIVIAAGPSLAKNIFYLKSVQGRVLLIAVDSTLKLLLDQGIHPDFVVSIDYTCHNYSYFQDLPCDQPLPILVVDPEVYPPIIHDYPGKVVMAHLENKPVLEWMEASLNRECGYIEKGMSVAHTAFHLACYVGCDPIILIGHDLAYSDHMSHVVGSVRYQPLEVQDHFKEVEYVEDIFARQVATSIPMVCFLKNFENIIYQSKRHVIDATEGGARIQGTDIQPLNTAILSYISSVLESPYPCVEKKEDDIHNMDPRALAEKFQDQIEGMKRVSGYAAQGKNICARQLHQIVSGDDSSEERLSWAQTLRQLKNEGMSLGLLRDVTLKGRMIIENRALMYDTTQGHRKLEGIYEYFKEIEENANYFAEALDASLGAIVGACHERETHVLSG